MLVAVQPFRGQDMPAEVARSGSVLNPAGGRSRSLASLEIASMSKALTISGLLIAVLLFVLFTLDLSLGIPFSGASPTFDIGLMVCSLILGVLSWLTFRELK